MEEGVGVIGDEASVEDEGTNAAEIEDVAVGAVAGPGPTLSTGSVPFAPSREGCE